MCELDGHGNARMSQKWNFDHQYRLVPSTVPFILKFDWAARMKGVSSPATSAAKIFWNGDLIADIKGKNYQVNHASYIVPLKSGDNKLEIVGAGKSDCFGMNVDNVKLVAPWNSRIDLIKNGDFEDPRLCRSWQAFPGGIPSWSANKAEVGNCHSVYNSNWPVCSGQCIELDTDVNEKYTQTVQVPSCNFNSYWKSYS